jgi:hypothetical protein
MESAKPALLLLAGTREPLTQGRPLLLGTSFDSPPRRLARCRIRSQTGTVRRGHRPPGGPVNGLVWLLWHRQESVVAKMLQGTYSHLLWSCHNSLKVSPPVKWQSSEKVPDVFVPFTVRFHGGRRLDDVTGEREDVVHDVWSLCLVRRDGALKASTDDVPRIRALGERLLGSGGLSRSWRH